MRLPALRGAGPTGRHLEGVNGRHSGPSNGVQSALEPANSPDPCPNALYIVPADSSTAQFCRSQVGRGARTRCLRAPLLGLGPKESGPRAGALMGSLRWPLGPRRARSLVLTGWRFHSRLEGPRARAPRVPVTFSSGLVCPGSVSWRSGEVLEPVGPQNSHASVQYAARVGLVYYLSKKLSSIFEFKTA